MRDTASSLRGADLFIAAFLNECVGDALKAVYPRADVCRRDLLLETEATAAHPSGFMPGQRD